MKEMIEQFSLYVYYITIGAVVLMLGSTTVFLLLDFINRSFPN